jgi:molecular chaperone DnaK
MPDELIVGIDLGTTNSEIAVYTDTGPVVLTEQGDPILPSFVGLSETGQLLVGHAARNQWVVAPERTIKSIKRKMGQNVRVRLGDTDYTPQEISAMILRKLKERAERELQQPVRKAVITVPAFFNDSQRQATREAGELAGLEVVRILNEPTAAALTYKPPSSELHRVLVYDLGGGTFDVSIVQAEAEVVEVLASVGDTHLGGDDFDDLLLDYVCERFLTEHGVNLLDEVVAKSRVLRAVELAKRTLSDHPFARITEEFIAEKDGIALHLDLEVSRSEYEALIQPLLMRTLESVQQALDDACLTPRHLDRIILVGGSTRTPLIGQMLHERFGLEPHREVNPDLCVALGAAIQGAIIAGRNVQAVLVDVTPHSLGIRYVEPNAHEDSGSHLYRFARVIARNTSLPKTASEVFQTIKDRQEAVEIEIYQGEHDDVRRNTQVGSFMIEGLSPVPAGNQLIVQFDLTLDGTLKVTAREKATGLQKQVTIQNALADFERNERLLARERLQRLWVASDPSSSPATAEPLQPDEQLPMLIAGPREGQRESVQAKALLEKAERLAAKASADDRAELQLLIDDVRTALLARNWAELQRASDVLADLLFYMEDA